MSTAFQASNAYKIVAGSRPLVGVLGLQGDFAKHCEALHTTGADTRIVKHSAQLDGINALVIPGGESTTLLKLIDEDLQQQIIERVQAGLPLLATCAGLIIAAQEVLSPSQRSLGLLEVTVERNGYGRQIDSFIAPLELTPAGAEVIGERSNGNSNVQGIFIRAPKICWTSNRVVPLALHNQEPVLLIQENIIAASFHPELCEGPSVVHGLLLDLISQRSQT